MLAVSCAMMGMVSAETNAQSQSQPAYQMGGHPVRVRLLLANRDDITHLLGDSPEHDVVSADPILTDHIGMFASVVEPPAAVGIGDLGEQNDYYAGLSINPPLLGCGLDMVRAVERAAGTRPDLLADVEEVNVVIKPVRADSGANVVITSSPPLGVGPVLPVGQAGALNIRLPFVAPLARCQLPTFKTLMTLLQAAARPVGPRGSRIP
jgi:hypothetical protein